MENKKRLIDANDPLKQLSDYMEKLHCLDDYRDGLYREMEMDESYIKNAPTVDAVEVVRCKGCRDCEMWYPEKQLDKEATQAWFCKRYKRYRKPDDFCSYGERRD